MARWRTKAKSIDSPTAATVRVSRHKYGAKATVVDGIRFASKKEAKRYGELKLLEKAGEIHELQLQPRFELFACPDYEHNNPPVRLGEYRGDFRYRDMKRGRIVEDVKGFKTPFYRWKKKHVEAQYGVQIVEI